eukprot:647642-Ditylum_brightwellii.AAC.1
MAPVCIFKFVDSRLDWKKALPVVVTRDTYSQCFRNTSNHCPHLLLGMFLVIKIIMHKFPVSI